MNKFKVGDICVVKSVYTLDKLVGIKVGMLVEIEDINITALELDVNVVSDELALGNDWVLYPEQIEKVEVVNDYSNTR